MSAASTRHVPGSWQDAAGLCQEILARASPQPARSQLYLTSTTALGDSLAVVSRGRVVADVTLTS